MRSVWAGWAGGGMCPGCRLARAYTAGDGDPMRAGRSHAVPARSPSAASATMRRHLPRCLLLSAIDASCSSQLIWLTCALYATMGSAPTVLPGPQRLAQSPSWRTGLR